MTLTTHATLGAVIGKLSGNPILGFVLAFITHLLIDMIPHGDTGISDNFRIHKKNKKMAIAYVAIDAVVAICFVLLIMNTRGLSGNEAVTWGIVGGVMPDMLVAVYEVTKSPLLRWFYKVHFFFHDFFVKRRGEVPLYYAILAQIVFIAYLQTKL